MNCKNCGATIEGKKLLCEYCGVASGNISSDAEEMEAVNSLLIALQRAATITPPSSKFEGNIVEQAHARQAESSAHWTGGGPVGRILSGMWTPHSIEAKVRLCSSMMSMGKTGKLKRPGWDVPDPAHDASIAIRDSALERVLGMLDAADITNPGDARTTAIRLKVEAAVEAMKKGKSQANPLVWMLMILFAMFGAGGGLVAWMGRSEAKCRGQDASCDGRCRQMACSELCSDNVQWACVGTPSAVPAVPAVPATPHRPTASGSAMRVAVTVGPRKLDGRAWDAFGGAPDVAVCLTVGGQRYCEPGGGASVAGGTPVPCQDALTCSFEIPEGALPVDEGSSVSVEVIDVDLSQNDPIGAGDCTIGSPCTIGAAQVTISIP